MNKYELTILISSSIKGEAKDKLTDKIEKIVKAVSGKVGKMTEMGQKQLAYKIKNQGEAEYLSWTLELPNEGVVQLGKKLIVECQKKEILRHLLVKI